MSPLGCSSYLRSSPVGTIPISQSQVGLCVFVSVFYRCYLMSCSCRAPNTTEPWPFLGNIVSRRKSPLTQRPRERWSHCDRALFGGKRMHEVVSMSSPEEEHLWDDLSTRIILTVLQLKLHFLLAATVLYLGYLLSCDGAMSWP